MTNVLKCFPIKVFEAPDGVVAPTLKFNFFHLQNKKKESWAGADWPYNEVGKIPRGPSSRLGAHKAIGGPSASWPFFFLDQLDLWKFSVWAAAIALSSSYLMTLFFFFFFFFRCQQSRFCSNFCFGGPLKKNPTKIWGGYGLIMNLMKRGFTETA
jgi:hypothetical protein